MTAEANAMDETIQMGSSCSNDNSESEEIKFRISYTKMWRDSQEKIRLRGVANRKKYREARRAAGEAERTRVRREKARDRQRKHRAALAAAAAPDPAELALIANDLKGLELLPVAIDEQRLAGEEAAFRAWVSTPGRRQGQLRKVDVGAFLLTRRIYLKLQDELPSWTIYARKFAAGTGCPWGRFQAKRRVQMFIMPEGEGGPWRM